MTIIRVSHYILGFLVDYKSWEIRFIRTTFLIKRKDHFAVDSLVTDFKANKMKPKCIYFGSN